MFANDTLLHIFLPGQSILLSLAADLGLCVLRGCRKKGAQPHRAGLRAASRPNIAEFWQGE